MLYSQPVIPIATILQICFGVGVLAFSIGGTSIYRVGG
ncbi:hypothetical protein NIES37_49520 [Tolypothrix tenuis PCC 7101]|uniref:Uncharacterized protein n=1 Tax=Tolypothrix tenuis PCC 7101 TaxID=231146 RepID=A0A1Z4N5H3_9CYAN|nr:hypothetical protein NIES37_49520 [Tolypothrix tenuis PCC 7101]BAZ75123.1 hypothetical protein NIES50_37030 [Aulosira laxa NIES-50]